MTRHALPCDVRGLECICDVENRIKGGKRMPSVKQGLPRSCKQDETLRTVKTICFAAITGLDDAAISNELRSRFEWKNNKELANLRRRLNSLLNLLDTLE